MTREHENIPSHPALVPLSVGNWLALLLITSALYVVSLHNYLLFHGLIELFSIVVAFGVFILAWNAKHILRENFLLFLGISYLYVGGLDLVHVISYKGMGVVDHASANLGTQLWIGARYSESLALLGAPFFVSRRVYPLFCLTSLGFVCGALLWVIASGHFPVCYVEGQGLTPFKINSEYLIIAIFLAAFLALRHQRPRLEARVYSLLAASILFSIASELTFTIYVGAYGFANMAGHILKFISFFLVYKALIETGLKRPFSLLSNKLRHNERLLRQSEKEFRAMFELSAVGMAQFHPRSHLLLRVNNTFCAICGYSAEELRGMTIADLTHPQDREQDLALLRGAILGRQESLSHETRYIRKDGAVIWVRATCSVLHDEPQQLHGAMAVITDITESKHAEQALRESEQKLKLIAASVKDVIWMRTPDHNKTLFISKAYEEVWGRSCASLYERPWSFTEAIHPDDRDRVLADSTRHHAGGQWRYDYRIVCPDGSERWIDDTGSPVLDDTGQVRMVVGVARDITARKLVEEERLRHNRELEEKVQKRTRSLVKKVEQVRGMAMRLSNVEHQERLRIAEVLHGDLQQLLAAGAMQAERLLIKGEPLAQQTRQLEFVVDILKKAHGTVRSLSHDLSPPILSHGGMSDILRWLAHRTRELHGLEVEFSPCEGFEVHSESLKCTIYRFVQELLFNVVKHAKVDKAWLTMEIKDGSPCVSVRDQGRGFDPGFMEETGATTPPGIGLFSIAERLRMLGGAMHIDSTPGQGCRTTLFLPPSLA